MGWIPGLPILTNPGSPGSEGMFTENDQVACRVHQMHDGGDHWIVVGEVVDLYHREKEPWPLLFFEGGYHQPSRMAGQHLEPAADPFK